MVTTMYSIKFSVHICYNVFNQEEGKSMVRAMTLIFHTVFYQLVQSVPIDRAVAQCYLYI